MEPQLDLQEFSGIGGQNLAKVSTGFAAPTVLLYVCIYFAIESLTRLSKALLAPD